MSPTELENLRQQYRQFRAEAVRHNHEDGFNNEAFDSLVRGEMERKDMLPTPENWVKMARIMCRDLVANSTEYENFSYEYGVA